MKRPPFETDGRGRVIWTPDRIAYVRHLAEVQHFKAWAIAEDIGIGAENRARVFAICAREGIELTGGGRPRSRVELAVCLSVEHASVVQDLAKRGHVRPRDIAEKLLTACLSEGVTFCANLIDTEA